MSFFFMEGVSQNATVQYLFGLAMIVESNGSSAIIKFLSA